MKPYDIILVRFGELNTKGKNKSHFIGTLYHNIKYALHDYKALTIEKGHDRIYISINGEDFRAVCDRLGEVSGIQSFSPAYTVSANIEALQAQSLEMVEPLEPATFKVETKRADKNFPIHSDEVNRMIANVILDHTAHKVDVHHPVIRVKVEIRPSGTFVFFESYPGLGGYPLGVGGKCLVMLSGGIDSPVSAYLMMKRGVKVEAIHFASPPYTSDGAKQKVIDLLKVLSKIQGNIKLYVVPFTKLQEVIYEQNNESYAVILMRRMMYRIAEGIALKNQCLVLAGGESIGQVASQTLHSMQTINEVIKIPMIRPLAIFDKNDIITIAKKIHTFDISIRPFVDCCTIFDPRNPATKPTIRRAEEIESHFDFKSLVQECIDNVEVIYVDPNYSSIENTDQFY